MTLWNTGDDAYRHDQYGDFLTIERKFRKNGVSVWKVLTSTGESVSTITKKEIKKKDIYHILDHLNINVVNPMAIMTQVRGLGEVTG